MSRSVYSVLRIEESNLSNGSQNSGYTLLGMVLLHTHRQRDWLLPNVYLSSETTGQFALTTG